MKNLIVLPDADIIDKFEKLADAAKLATLLANP
jgi:hypothetical protein